MVKTLQRKFVITAMAAITVLMLFMLGAVNIANRIITGNEVERKLRLILENEENPLKPVPAPDEDLPGFPTGAPKNNYDTVMSSNFFVVRFDRDGNIVYVDVSRTSSVSENEAKILAEKAVFGGKETVEKKETEKKYEEKKYEEKKYADKRSGKDGKFRYLEGHSQAEAGTTVIFLDVSEESVSYVRVLFLSAAIGIVCWGAMLVFVRFLSGYAIRPIAENIEKQKQFVTNAGHEIKTPLAIIQSNTEAMELFNGVNKWSKNIKEQVVRLDGLMKDLLALARMDEGALKVNASEFSVSELSARVIQEFIQPMETRGITVQADIRPEVFLYADQKQAEQLLMILLDNSLKYTNEGGQVRFFLEKEGKRVSIQVQNTCEVLPDVPPDKLFDRFYRADTARTQKNGGYGIGLSMARFLAEANKGTVRAAYGGGNTVCFTVCFMQR